MCFDILAISSVFLIDHILLLRLVQFRKSREPSVHLTNVRALVRTVLYLTAPIGLLPRSVSGIKFVSLVYRVRERERER